MEQEVYKVSNDLKTTLSEIASLSNHKNTKVALSARQVKGHWPISSLKLYIILCISCLCGSQLLVCVCGLINVI